jgi:GTPase SAR1 family protein
MVCGIGRYLLQNLDWLHEALGEFEDDYLLIDCPGQIELYTHIPIMPRLIAALQQANIRPCACYLLESQFMEDKSKFFAGVLSAMSCMINLEVPHINIMSKMDLVKSGKTGSTKLKKDVDRYLETDPMLLYEQAKNDTNPRFQALNEALVQLVRTHTSLGFGSLKLTVVWYAKIEDFNMVQFLPLDLTDEDSITLVLSHIDNAIQYGEAEVSQRCLSCR